jgi:hypothetical protein
MGLIKKYIFSLTNKYYPKEDQPDTLYKTFFRQFYLLTTIWVVLLILRVPILANANVFLDADEGFIATHMVEAIKSGNFSLLGYIGR